MSETKEVKPEPNIKFVGKPGQEQTAFIDGNSPKVVLPEPKDQQKPFYHEKAALIVKVFRGLYKLVKPGKRHVK